MSTELKTVAADNNPEVSVTSFFGGNVRGRCVQLTALSQGDGFQLAGTVNVLQLTESQARELVSTLSEWLS